MTSAILIKTSADPITLDRVAAWVDQADRTFKNHRSHLATKSPKLATLIVSPNPFLSDYARMLAEIAIDRGDDPVDVLVRETRLSKKDIERIAGINPNHIGANWQDHLEDLHSLLETCPTLVPPDTEEGWDVLYRFWNCHGPSARDRFRLPKLWYLVQFQALYAQRYPGISLEDMDAMFGGVLDLHRVWGYSEFVSQLLDGRGPTAGDSPWTPFLSQFEPAELIKQADLCHTQMFRITKQAHNSQDATLDDWPRLIQGPFTHGPRTAVSLVTPAELMREGAMLFEFAAHFPGDLVSGEWHLVAIQSPEEELLSIAEFILDTEGAKPRASCALHFAIDGSDPSPDCVACVSALETHLDHPMQIARLRELARRFSEPDSAMRALLAQFKLKSVMLGAEALSAVLANCWGSPEWRASALRKASAR